ncbi:MAG: hypothetical protein ACW964_04360 [Candidatus Hodarchaeales archaeon]|jgi:hypothetical protein
MVKPVNESEKSLSNRPFFTKLGFFTKKGYVIYVFWALILDYIYVLIYAKDKLEVLQFGMPYTATILVIFHIIFIGGLYIISKIKSLFGIDLTANEQELDLHTPQLSPLFTEKGFQEFQSYTHSLFNKRWITYIAIFFTALVATFGLWAPFILFQKDEWIENFPELAANGLSPYLIFRLGPYSLIALWFLFIVVSLLLSVIQLMRVFNALGNFSGLSISKISDYFDTNSNQKSSVFSQNFEVVQFSLKRFRRKCRIIPQMFLKINLLISLGTFIIGMMFSIYTSYIINVEARNYTLTFFFPIISGIMILNLLVFIFPQFSLHNHLELAKESFLEKIEEIYEVKRFQYLNLAFDDNLEEKKEKELLLSELQALNQMIIDIEDIITWPFNYNQIGTLLFGIAFPFLPLYYLGLHFPFYP